jgi:fructokinase
MNTVSFGEALWDLLPDGAVLGGAPLNLAYRLKSVGFRSTVVSSLGRDERGVEARRLIRGYGLDDRFVFTHDSYPTGTVVVSFDRAGEPEYVIVRDAAYDGIPDTPELEEVVRNADCFCFGTLVQRSPVSRNTLKKLLLARPGRTNLLDINLRPDCYSRETVNESLDSATILKINEGEAVLLKKWYGLEGSDYRDLVLTICRRFELDCCILTLGPKGACAAASDGKVCTEPAFDVPRIDPCGAGDAFTAGFLSVYLNGGTLSDACRRGNALGSAVTGRRGALQEITDHEVEKLEISGTPYTFSETDFRVAN